MSDLRSPVSRQQGGYSYLLLLFMVVMAGLGLAKMGYVWHHETLREKEADLLFIGNEFRRAIGRYFEGAPDGKKVFPLRLEDLLEDDRFPTPRRHLRRLYADPMTGSTEWGLILTPDKRIAGVYSLHAGVPIKRNRFPAANAAFAAAATYTAWRFNYEGPDPTGKDALATSGAPAVAGIDTVALQQSGDSTLALTRVSAPAPVPMPTPPPRADDEKLRKICDNVRRLDAGKCDSIEAQRDAYAAQPCRDSAALRQQMCLNPTGMPMPPLVTTFAE